MSVTLRQTQEMLATEIRSVLVVSRIPFVVMQMAKERANNQGSNSAQTGADRTGPDQAKTSWLTLPGSDTNCNCVQH